MIRKNWKKLFSLTIMLLLAVLAGTVALADTETTHSTYALLIEKQVVERLSDGSEKAIDSCETEYTFKIEGQRYTSNGTTLFPCTTKEDRNETITGNGKKWVSYNSPDRRRTEDDEGLTVTELNDDKHSLDIDGYTYLETEVTYNFCKTSDTELRVPGNKPLVANNVEVSTNGYSHIIFKNIYEKVKDKEPTGSLTVSKTVTEGGSKEKEFNFVVTVEVDGKPIPDGTYGGMTFNDSGTAEFKLTDGGSMKAEGLPIGANYKVVETPEKNWEATTPENAEGTITEENAEVTVTFVNTFKEEEKPKTGSLTVKKTVEGTETEQEFEFEVTVTKDGTPIKEGRYGGMTLDADGPAKFG